MPDTTTSNRSLTLALGAAVLLLGPAFAGCLSGGSGGTSLTQTGSSTVLPLAQRWAGSFEDASVSVSGGGSSQGLNALLKGNADLGDASRKITPGDYQKVGCSVDGSEIESARSGKHPWQYPTCNDVEPTEWVVAYDVLTVIVHPSNDWLQDGLNYTQLQSIFTTENTAEYWDEVPGLSDAPHEKIKIFAPDEASGTYEFFFEEIAGSTESSLLASGSPRYSGSANDNEIVRAIKSNPTAIGFLGFAYYQRNQDSVQAVPIAEEGAETIRPSFETVADYPITRPLHIYTDGVPTGNSTKAQAINGYLTYVLGDQGQSIVPDVGYIKVADVDSQLAEEQRAALQ